MSRGPGSGRSPATTAPSASGPATGMRVHRTTAISSPTPSRTSIKRRSPRWKRSCAANKDGHMAEWTKRFALDGKTALVTGATKGIGLETCKVLADAGADIAAIGRDPDGLREIKAAVEARGCRCAAIAADMSTVDGPAKAAQEASSALGPIDILVNNAAIALIAPLLEA